MSARVLAYRLASGAEPDREVLTTCDTTCCLNPRHLVLAGGAKSKATLRKRFEAKVAVAGPDECWLWKTRPGAAGYGSLSMGRGNNPVLAHRVAWDLANGPIPEGLFVRQRCWNRLCCNPAQLFLALNPVDTPEASATAVFYWLRSRAGTALTSAFALLPLLPPRRLPPRTVSCLWRSRTPLAGLLSLGRIGDRVVMVAIVSRTAAGLDRLRWRLG